MHKTQNDKEMSKRAFVTGGGGYVGNKLCQKLLERGYAVTSFDLHYPQGGEDGRELYTRIQGDIREKDVLFSALADSKSDVVFHIASYGMSGREMLNKDLIETVNVTGTRNMIEACLEHGATRLVYTSTYNVVFGGQEIKNGDENIDYLPLDKHVDDYSRTKSIAEQEVLHANGKRTKHGGSVLKTCALRCAGIYGEGEQRHLPRIVSYIERGLFKFTYGAKDSLVEFLHGDNFCQAHIKAAEAMDQPRTCVPGCAYYISDGKPINNFEFFRPLVEGLGCPYPSIRLPLSLIYCVAFLTELIHSFVGRYVYNFQPLLTRAEVFKTGVTHYFSMERAQRDFGYQPEPRTLDGVVKWFRERGHGRPLERRRNKSVVWSVLANVILILLVCLLGLSFLPVIE